MNKYICPHCKKDLMEVGLYNIQTGFTTFDCDIISEKGEIGNWVERDFEAEDAGTFYCGDCNGEIDLDKLGLTL